MKAWPDFNETGDLPVGLHLAELNEVLGHFGVGSTQRVVIGRRLAHIHALAMGTGAVARFIVFGSFVTSKSAPNDVDIFLVMDDSLDVRNVHGEAQHVFDHMAAHNLLGASVFWIPRAACMGGEDAAVNDWQFKRDGAHRGIVEVMSHD
jgi:hypothetical protein